MSAIITVIAAIGSFFKNLPLIKQIADKLIRSIQKWQLRRALPKAVKKAVETKDTSDLEGYLNKMREVGL